ncbi:MAG: hypothetical protein IT319_20015, partial [Anaerolineae bacterium]|nr:hypothetical protein [Anaerolineae bacterium]
PDKRAAVFLRRRRIHCDQRARIAPNAKITPKTGVRRSGFERQRGALQSGLNPARELLLSLHVIHCLNWKFVRFYHSLAPGPMMPALRSRLIAVTLLCASAAVTAADGPALGFKPGDEGPRLKLQPSLLRLPAENSGPLPLFVDADNLQGHQDRELEADGTGRLRRRGQAIYADWLRYDKPDDQVRARGNVRLEQRGDVLEGTEMRIQLETGRGAIEKPN